MQFEERNAYNAIVGLPAIAVHHTVNHSINFVDPSCLSAKLTSMLEAITETVVLSEIAKFPDDSVPLVIFLGRT